MIYKRYYDTREFYNATYTILLKHEAQNSLPLGNVVLGNKGGTQEGWRNIKNWYMATVSDNICNIKLIAIMTPPFNITMYETDNIPDDEVLECFCDNVLKENVNIPGVTSESNLAYRFAKMYTEKMNLKYTVHKNLRIYTLTEVDKSVHIIGNLRKAERKDIFYLPYWNLRFYENCNLGTQSLIDTAKSIEFAINRGMLFVLEVDGMPVSMASALREIINGRCVSMVYTPPHLRNNGYASSCVAQLSQKVLDMGYEYVSLFTDLSNPTSNSIYQKIGYRPICDYDELQFII